MMVTLDPETAANAVLRYNAGSYRGRLNTEVDRAAYHRFSAGMPAGAVALVDAIRFVGEDFGGAQRRFLPHGYFEEAALIAAHLTPVLPEWQSVVGSATTLRGSVFSEATAALLLEPFIGTKRWPVWATKTLHFIRPDAFPILDSRVKTALHLKNLGSTPRDYVRFSTALRQLLLGSDEALQAARHADLGESPSDLKLLDKILYELGGS